MRYARAQEPDRPSTWSRSPRWSSEEAQLAGERKLVAAVIYNRLREGIPLGIDATIRFATGNYSSR